MKKTALFHQLIVQVFIIFAIGVALSGLVTFFSQKSLSDDAVIESTENRASAISAEVARAVREYPAYRWLLMYWHQHSEELDIEYDTDFISGTLTEEKWRKLIERNPGFSMRYAGINEIRALSEEDQKLYAEITYSWLITRVNQIKRSYSIDFLFCVLTDDTFKEQFFLFSAADPDAVRGRKYEETYTLGTTYAVSESQQIGMREARRNSSHLADAGTYVDYYSFMDFIDGYNVLLGMTFSLADLRQYSAEQARTGITHAIAQQLFFAVFCLYFMYGFVINPLKFVQRNIRLYKHDKDSHTVIRNLSEIKLKNEIGELSEDITELVDEMDHYMDSIRRITAEQERLDTEMHLATRIQATMLPHDFPAFPDREEFDIYASMDPAKAVGGDFYDFFLVDEDHLCMVIADVSGKGVPAALFMMVSKAILQNSALLGHSAAEILTKTNEMICSNNVEQMFVTVWLGILEISTGKVTAANAGHEYPALKRGSSRFELMKDRHGFVIGGMEGIRYREYEFRLQPGDKIFVYTDGVPEATDAEEKMFGTKRMLDALNLDPEASPEQILENVQSQVDSFVKDAEQFDDLTMLCLEYKSKS